MQLEVGDVLQWKDDPKLGADAGQLMLVVELIEEDGVAWPRIGVAQDGTYATWTWSVISNWCTKVAQGGQE